MAQVLPTDLKRSNSYELLPPDMSELRVVLLGNSWSERCSVGNLLLDQHCFNPQQEPNFKINGKEINYKILYVINTPDLLQLDLKEDRLTELIKETARVSAPGPHVFLLVLQPEDFTDQHKTRLLSVLERFNEQAFNHSLLLISTPRGEGFMEKYENEPHIMDMIFKCRFRYLWMNTHEHDLKLKHFKFKELLSKIHRVVNENNAKHLEYEPFEEPSSNTENLTKPQHYDILRKVKSAEITAVENLKPGQPLSQVSELRVVLLGNSWKLRSAVGNLLLENDAFDLQRECKHSIKIDGPLQEKRLYVTNTSDLLQPELPANRLTELIREVAEASAPGPHVFLVVLQPEDFTEQQNTILQIVLQSFGEQAFNRSLVLISTPRVETPGFMDKYMNDPQIRDMIRKCSYKYLWMTNIQGDPIIKAFKRKELLTRMGQMMEILKEQDFRPLTQGNTMADYEEDIKAALQNNDLALAVENAQKYLNKFNSVRLNIAITGESGTGKSTLVNALRGIRNNTEGAAPTGVRETSMEPTEYLHPQNPNVRLWDLPGVGTTRFTADKYLEYMGLKKFDFFIIVSSDRFRENDAKLAKEIHKMKKKLYFVRSKIDHNIQDEKDCDPNLNEENLLKLIREDCIRELQKLGFESPKVFLVSGLKLHLYEFEDLWKSLCVDLPKLQRDALLLTLPNISLDVIEQKKQDLESKIKWYTIASAAGSPVSVPDLSVSVDLSTIITFTEHCLNSLGLTPEILQKLSDVSGVPLEDLRAELKSPLSGAEITRELMVKVLSGSATFITASTIEERLKFVPIIGTVVAMSLASVTTYYVLTYILNSLAEDAQRVINKSMGLTTSV